MTTLNELTKTRAIQSNWDYEILGKTPDGCLPARVVMIKHDPLYQGQTESFSTHVETQNEDGTTGLIWGHYDMILEDALKDYYRRLCSLLNRKCHLPARDELPEPKENEVAYIVTIPDERIKDLLVTAFEGGSNDWYFIQEYNYPRGENDKSLGIKYPHIELPLIPGASLTITDVEAQDGDTPGFEPVTLDREAINRGLNLMAQNYAKDFQDFIDENEDANTADIFLQLCCFGEVVYG